MLGRWYLDAKPEQLIKSSLDTPAVGVGGVIKGTSTLVKVGAGAVGGLLLGKLLGGGQEQRQAADVKQTPTQDTLTQQRTEQVLDIWAKIRAQLKADQDVDVTVKPETKYVYEGPTITGGGDVSYVGPTTITETTTVTGVTQEQFAGLITALQSQQQSKQTPTQITISTIGQEQQATSVDSSGLIIIAAILGGAYLLRGKI